MTITSNIKAQGDYEPTYGHPSNSYSAKDGKETLDYVFFRWRLHF